MGFTADSPEVAEVELINREWLIGRLKRMEIGDLAGVEIADAVDHRSGVLNGANPEIEERFGPFMVYRALIKTALLMASAVPL